MKKNPKSTGVKVALIENERLKVRISHLLLCTPSMCEM